MKKNPLIVLLAIVLGLSVVFAACSKTPKVDEVLEKNFVVDTTPVEVNLGDSYMIVPVSAKDSKGNWHDATITVTDADGNVTDAEAGNYTPAKLGTYKITYKIESLTREIEITVSDLAAPEISGMTADSLVLLGDEVDLSKITVKDNLDGDIVPQISVKFGDKDIVVTDNKFVADREGCYVVTVKATDAAGNKLEETLNVFTSINYEQDVLQTSEFYPMTISNKFDSYRRGNVAKVNWFDMNVNWLNDFCLLGSKTTFLSEAKYLSFWTYFDGEATDLNNLLIQTKYTYFDTKVFTEYGQELGYYWNFKLTDNAPAELKEMYAASEGKFTYEMEANKWYRIVIDLTKLTNASKYGGTADGYPIDGPLEAKANPNGFAEVPFGFGMYDRAIGGQPTKVVDTYIDDIRLTNVLDDETYRKEIKVDVTSSKSIIGQANETFKINYTVTPEGSGSASFRSTNEEVATVDENGVITLVAKGQAQIVVTSVADTRKSDTINVTVLGVGDKVRDENNQVIFSGGKSIGSWETEGKYNMIEHMAWASNEYDNGVCGHNSLVSMSIAHGNLSSYSPLIKDSDNNFVGGGESPVKIVGGWQAFIGGTDGLLFVFTAKKDVSIKTGGDTVDKRVGGWISDTNWQWVKIKADGTTETLKEKKAPAFEDMDSDWFELKAGETFVLLVRSVGDADTRNFEILPFFYVCPMVELTAE